MNKYKYIDKLIEKGYIKKEIYEVYDDGYVKQLNEYMRYFDERFCASLYSFGINEESTRVTLDAKDEYTKKIAVEIIYKIYSPLSQEEVLNELDFLKWCPFIDFSVEKEYSIGHEFNGMIDGKDAIFTVVDKEEKEIPDASGRCIELNVKNDINDNTYRIEYDLLYYSKCRKIIIK